MEQFKMATAILRSTVHPATAQQVVRRVRQQARANPSAHLPRGHLAPPRIPRHSKGQQRLWENFSGLRAQSDGSTGPLNPEESSKAKEEPAQQQKQEEAKKGASGQVQGLKQSVAEARARMDGLWHKFIPMVLLFFFMAFINTTVDSMKDTIVVTAVGSGPHVIPFLTAYGTLPAAIIFLVVFSAASQRFGREQLFNGIVVTFVAFFALFGWVLYPMHETLHWYGLGAKLTEMLPVGLSGLVVMVQNWTFTLFYVAAELWGDVGLSLLFWGLANEITSHDEAPLLYPLFGVGANMAQVLAGRFLNFISSNGSSAGSFVHEQRIIMTAAAAVGVLVLIVHNYVCRSGMEQQTMTPSDPVALSTLPERKRKIHEKKKKPSLRAALQILLQSPQIRCLAIMALAQGICTNMLDVAWKTHLRMLFPSPAEYSAAMGNVATLCGIVTGVLMLVSPILFKRWGWGGAASTTPTLLLFGGVPFFAVAIFYNAFGLGAVWSPALLQGMVAVGTILYVICRGAKFSLFKPAEEMVYIGLDEESRTKGKAAIDVVGAQTGKAMSSGLQQLLLVFGGGQLAMMLPFMGVTFAGFLVQWKKSVAELSEHFMDKKSREEKDWHGITVDEEMMDSTSLKEIDAEIAKIVSEKNSLESPLMKKDDTGNDVDDDGRNARPAVIPT